MALGVTDRTGDAVAAASEHPQTAAAALSALHQFLDGPTIDRLAQVVGLTQSGAVRLVDRLERDGYVRRGPGPDGRTTSVILTPSGRRAAEHVEALRRRVLEEALDPLTVAERQTLADLMGRVLVGMMREPGATRWTNGIAVLPKTGTRARPARGRSGCRGWGTTWRRTPQSACLITDADCQALNRNTQVSGLSIPRTLAFLPALISPDCMVEHVFLDSELCSDIAQHLLGTGI